MRRSPMPWPSCVNGFVSEDMELAVHQRTMLGLIRGTRQIEADDDPYVHHVGRSRDLEEARGNILLWRIYVLERTCVLTVELLRGRNLLERTLQTFIGTTNLSPFREFQPRAFLAFLHDDADPLIRSVSQFESALMQVREGVEGTFRIDWTVEPRRVLKALACGEPVDGQLVPGAFISYVSRSLPYLFETTPSGCI